jgi:hypothetical protein
MNDPCPVVGAVSAICAHTRKILNLRRKKDIVGQDLVLLRLPQESK